MEEKNTAQTYLTERVFSDRMTELFEFLVETFATKDDLKNFATKDDIESLRLEMQSGFREIHGELSDIQASLARLEQKTQEDDDAMVQEVQSLKKRVKMLEDTIAILKKQKVLV